MSSVGGGVESAVTVDAAIAKNDSSFTWVKRGPGPPTMYVVGVIVYIHSVHSHCPFALSLIGDL